MSDTTLSTVIDSATLAHLVQQNQSAYCDLQDRNRQLTDECTRLTAELETAEAKYKDLFEAADRLGKMNDRQVQLLSQVINNNEKECTIVGLKHQGIKMTVAAIRHELLKHANLVVKHYRKYINTVWALRKSSPQTQELRAADILRKANEERTKRCREEDQTIVYCTNEE